MYYTTAMSKALFGKAVVTKDTKGIVKNTFDSDFSNYLADDWMRYWKSKAKERNIKYVPVKYKDIAVLKKLVKDFKSSDIKVMIDYIWNDSTSFVIRGEKLLPSSYGLFLLSGAFLNSVYNKAVLSKENIQEIPQRGWEGKAEESVKIDF